MACKLETRAITGADGVANVYAVRQLPATRALELQIELLNVCGPQIFDLIDGNYDYHCIVNIMRSTRADILTPLVKKCVVGIAVDGVELTDFKFDALFNGDLLKLMQAFALVLEVNFKDFLQGGKAFQERKSLAAVAALKPEEPKLEN